MSTTQDKIIDFVSVQPENGQIRVSWSFSTFKKIEKDGSVSCYIPSFDIYFSTKEDNKDAIRKKGITITKMFMDHFFMHTKSMKDFALEIHKRGFKAPNDAYTIKQFIDNKILKTKFKVAIESEKEGYSEKFTQESEMSVAV